MSTADDVLALRERRKRALLAWRDARIELRDTDTAINNLIRSNPPKTFRLQEAYKNPDNTYSVPHWDEGGTYADQNLIDGDELDTHIFQEGEWIEVYCNPGDDPRPGCRRVIEVQWS
jgi:hypothetical protein